ncbi:hypothetical protein TNCV_1029371 [Trichonephila clavipes]|nr:hypothetical protein TNCV_1029371 [Trichonephila clavipes]
MLWFVRGELPFCVRSLRRLKASLVLSLSIFGHPVSIPLHPASSGKWVPRDVKRLQDDPRRDYAIILKCRRKYTCGDPQRRLFTAA